MQSNFSMSQLIGILAMVAQAINFAFMIFGTWLADHQTVAIFMTATLAFIQSITGRVQGSNSSGK